MFSVRLTLLVTLLVVGLTGLVAVPGCGRPQDQAPPDQASPPRVAAPAFPWPPPRPSAECEIPSQWLPSTGEENTLGDVADALVNALRNARYRRWSFLSVPNGFALVAQMEQIRRDGTPTPEPGRWSTDVPSVRDLTLLEFVKALATSPPGHYRVIAFIVTDMAWSRTGKAPTAPDTERWIDDGLNRLPPSIGMATYVPGFATTALVYQFHKGSGNASATFVENSDLRAEDHLRGAGLAASLSGMR
jgi:hypothetical protein